MSKSEWNRLAIWCISIIGKDDFGADLILVFGFGNVVLKGIERGLHR